MSAVIEQRTEEWHQARKFRLTASDFAAAIGISPYKSRQELWREKTGRKPPFEGNEATLWGEMNECNAIGAYEIETGRLIFPSGLVIHPAHDWLAASPDGRLLDGGCVECKAPFSQRCHDAVPLHYLSQVIAVAECCDAPYCDFVSWVPEETRIWRIERSNEYWEWCFPLLQDFWKCVEDDIEPPKRRKPEFKGSLKIDRLK